MCRRNVLEHMIDGPFRCVALPVVTPATGTIGRVDGRSVGQTTTKWLVAFGVGALLVVRIEVRVR